MLSMHLHDNSEYPLYYLNASLEVHGNRELCTMYKHTTGSTIFEVFR